MNFQGLGILIALGFFVKAIIEFALAAVCFVIALIFRIFEVLWGFYKSKN